jgi:hypothetical protein
VLGTEALYYPLTVSLGGHYLAAAGVANPTAAALLLGETLASPNRWLPFAAMGLGFYLFSSGEVYAQPLLRWALAAPGSWPLALQRFFQRGWYFDAALNRLFFGAARPLLASSLTLEKGLLEWLGPWGVLQLCRAAGRRLDLLQLPRGGFGSLALVPLGYLLLLGLSFGGLLWAEEVALELLQDFGATAEAPAQPAPAVYGGPAVSPEISPESTTYPIPGALYPWCDKPRKLPMRGPLGHLQWLWWMAEPRILIVNTWMLGVSYDVYRLVVEEHMQLDPVPAYYNQYFNWLMKFWFGDWW